MRRREFITLLGGAAAAWGLQIQVVRAGTSRDIDAAFASDMRERDALFVGPSGFFASRRIHIVNLAILAITKRPIQVLLAWDGRIADGRIAPAVALAQQA